MLYGAVVYAKSMSRLVRFYEALGFAVSEAEPDYTLLLANGTELNLIQAPKAIAESISVATPAEMRTHTPIKLVFLVDSIETTAAQINAHGGRVDRGQARWDFGHYYVQDAVDPEGNIIQLRERKPQTD